MCYNHFDLIKHQASKQFKSGKDLMATVGTSAISCVNVVTCTLSGVSDIEDCEPR